VLCGKISNLKIPIEGCQTGNSRGLPHRMAPEAQRRS
jgi:hypothetical protein